MPLYPDFRSNWQAVAGNDSYFPSDKDESGTTKYYGLVTRTGAWIILQDDTTAGTIRYYSGKSGYTTSWTGRAGITYKYFYELV
jgi:hypothetical protein